MRTAHSDAFQYVQDSEGEAGLVLMRRHEQAWPPGTPFWSTILSLLEFLNQLDFPICYGPGEGAVVQCFVESRYLTAK